MKTQEKVCKQLQNKMKKHSLKVVLYQNLVFFILYTDNLNTYQQMNCYYCILIMSTTEILVSIT